jgi:hypothetical protein
MPKSKSKDFVATIQILFHADIVAIKPAAGRRIQGNSNLYIFNPWTSNRFFSNKHNISDMRGKTDN